MDKLKGLLKQMGASDELVGQLIGEMNAWKAETEKSLNEAYEARLAKAKKVCFEEVTRTKAEMARKVEIFLEAKTSVVEREARKQAAIGESASAKTLRELKSLLEGVEIGKEAKEHQAEIKALQEQLAVVEEQKVAAENKAIKSNTIAMKVLERNKVLESAAKAPAKDTVSEGTVNEGKEPAKSTGTQLETLRKPAETPKTSRPTLNESQQVNKSGTTISEEADPEIAQIASKLDGTPAFATQR